MRSRILTRGVASSRFGRARGVAWALFAVFLVPVAIAFALRLTAERPHWSEANHGTTGLAPAADETPEAVVQVYAARTWGLRGSVAVHTWIATKRAKASEYRRHEVIGWRLRRTGSALVQGRGDPDAQWFSNPPALLVDRRGEDAAAMIEKIEAVVDAYPYAREYRTWPGPNSNTFTAYVGRRVPELGLRLPPTAIGKDYLADGAWYGTPPSGSGVQVSLFGVVGLTASPREGIEVNLLGLVAGVGWSPFGVKLPGLGALPQRTFRG